MSEADGPSRALDRLVGPILDLTEGVCNVTDEATASLDDPDEQAILIAVKVVHESLQAQTAQTTAHQARFQAFFEASPDAVILLDGQNCVQRWNSAATQLLGRRAADVLDTPIETIVPALRPFLAGEAPEPRITLLRDRVPHTVDVALSRWREGAQWYKAVTLRDQTERLAQEQHQRQDQKMQALGQLAAGIAHEISTPMQYVSDNLLYLERSLQSLLTVVQAAQEEPAATSRLQQALQNLNLDRLKQEVPPAVAQTRNGLQHIGRIVGAMKDFAHKGRGEAEPVDLGQAIDTAVSLARSEWRHIAEVRCQYADDLPKVNGWADELKQVVLNLVVNAAHAIDQGPRRPGTIWIGAHADGDHVIIEVQDNGTGMTEEVRSRVFEPFFTTKDPGKGSGQGLSIAYGIVVERHQGDMDVESEVGVGTRFTVKLPQT
ncbi:MAG: ATP-binding protein [Myxococcota bacterium]